MLQRLLAVAILTVSLSISAFVQAADAPGKRSLVRYSFRLDYRVTGGLSGCPTRRQLGDIVSGALEYEAIRDDGPGLIEVELSRTGDKVQASMAVVGAGENWSTSITKAGTCHEVVLDALVHLDAAVSALILGPMQKKADAEAEAAQATSKALLPPSPLPPPALPAQVSPPPALAVPAPAPAPTLPPVRPLFQAGIGSVLSAGTAPVVTGGVGWMLGLRWPDYSAALEGRATFAPSAKITGYGVSNTYNFAFTAFSISGCLHHLLTAWAFACMRVEVGRLSGDLVDSRDYNTSHKTVFVASALRVGGEFALMRGLALRVYADLLTEMASASLVLETRGASRSLWGVPLVSGLIWIGPVISFGSP